jgi:hypothetical protein
MPSPIILSLRSSRLAEIAAQVVLVRLLRSLTEGVNAIPGDKPLGNGDRPCWASGRRRPPLPPVYCANNTPLAGWAAINSGARDLGVLALITCPAVHTRAAIETGASSHPTVPRILAR